MPAISSLIESVARELAVDSIEAKNWSSRDDALGTVVDWVDSVARPEDSTLAWHGPAEALIWGLGHFATLKSTPIVFHANVYKSFDAIASLRNSGFVFLQSFGAADAQDTAVAAHLLAQRLRQPVIHFFVESEGPDANKWTPELIAAAQARNLIDDEETDDIVEGDKTSAEEAERKTLSTRELVTKTLEITGLNPYEWRGPADADVALIVFGDADAIAQAAATTNLKAGVACARFYAPLDAASFLAVIPKTALRKIVVLEQAELLGLPPLFTDLVMELSAMDAVWSFRIRENTPEVLATLEKRLESPQPVVGMVLGSSSEKREEPTFDKELASQEDVYTRVLRQLLPNLNLLNAPESPMAPEYAFGEFLAAEQESATALELFKREKLSDTAKKWTEQPRNHAYFAAARRDNSSTPLEPAKQHWIISSDVWASDLGRSGLHHIVSSRRNVKLLVIDREPQGSVKGKKDVGLYALGSGNAYVASVAAYASYTQLLQALLEAESYQGPAVVVAYLPGGTDPLEALKASKSAVQSGYWPLYRYDPRKHDDDAMTLDSFVLRQSLKDFLSRENKLTLLSRRTPELARTLTASQQTSVVSEQRRRAADAYANLLAGLSGPPVLILFASDGGQAETVARRLARRAQARTLRAAVRAFDDVSEVEDLAREQNVVFITSTAGQGELPQNGRMLWDALKQTNDLDLSNTKVAVFGMGDSQYWPRKQDKHYYNKPSKDLWSRLQLLGAQTLISELGQGDDQDADGWSTGYDAWEPELWSALGVSDIDGGDEPPPLTNEDIKLASNYLRGTIAEGLLDDSTGAISASDQQLTKFHGIYMQDDRDVREARKAAGQEPAYAFMIRVRLPGCVATPKQWLAIDSLSDSRGNGTFKITTRGTFQLHGVVKENLKPAIRGMNAVLMDTVAACGDVDRNVVASALPGNASVHRQITKIAKDISEHLLPRTTAYYEIWLEGADKSDASDDVRAVWQNREDGGPTKKPERQLVASSPIEDVEPLYGPAYLPRKFKINIAVPPYNDVDVYGHDIGLITITEGDKVVGFNVLIGGGMGTTHNNRKTYPRTGSPIGFASVDEVLEVCEKVMLVQRDHGDRKNRKHARLKYTVDDMGVETYKAKVEEYLGRSLSPLREHAPFKTNVDTYGWVRDEEGRNHFTTFVENGRVEDTPDLQHRTGFRAIADLMLKEGEGEFRLTANQHILVADVGDSWKPKVDALLAQYKLDNLSFSGLRLSSAACVAFPTCGLAMAESERYLPELVSKLETALEEYGLRHDSVVMRMTGCPNGCARPWLAEVALVGKAYGAYNLMLGGGHVGQRLNKLYRSSLKEHEILDVLKPLFKSWSLNRLENEPFGDFVIREGVISETIQGLDWWDNVEPGLE